MADELSPDGNGKPLITEALHQGRHVPLHATMYFEHRARLSLLKAATDYLLAGGAVDVSDSNKIKVDFAIVDLPVTFLRGLSWLEAQPKYWLFPLFWQNFLWGWGGLLPDEHRDDVVSDVAQASGLTAEEAEVALEAFDELFPIESGWIRHMSSADYTYVVLTPQHFQGLGAFHQLKRSGLERYSAYVTTGQYTERDFVRWNNLAANLLETEATIGIAGPPSKPAMRRRERARKASKGTG